MYFKLCRLEALRYSRFSCATSINACAKNEMRPRGWRGGANSSLKMDASSSLSYGLKVKRPSESLSPFGHDQRSCAFHNREQFLLLLVRHLELVEGSLQV